MDKEGIKELLIDIQTKLDKKGDSLIVGRDISDSIVNILCRLELLYVNSSRTTTYLDGISWRTFERL